MMTTTLTRASGWAAVAVGATLAASAAVAAPIVRSVHRSPRNARGLEVSGDALIVTTGTGWRFAIGTAQVGRRGRILVPRSEGHRFSDSAAAESMPMGAAVVQGYPVSASTTWKGNSLTGTFGGGMFDDSGRQIPASPREVNALATVGGGVVVAHAEGLAVYDGRGFRDLRVVGPPSDDISALAYGAGAVWVGYFDAGLAVLKGGIWREVVLAGSGGARWINALCWHDGTLWVGSNAGLGRLDRETLVVEGVAGFDRTVKGLRVANGGLVVAENDAVWIESGEGWREVGLPQEALHTACLRDGEVWAGGMRGILVGAGDTWERLSELNGRLPESWVTALLPVGGGMWVGTYDAGLLRLDSQGISHALRSRLWVNPNALVAVPGGIAVGTMGDGLQLFDLARRRWHTLGVGDGLPSADVTAIAVGDDGALFLGTRAGLVEVASGLTWRNRP